MGKLKKKFKIIILFCISILCMRSAVFAQELTNYLSDTVEFSEEFQEWQKLSEEEKEKVIQPSTFVIPKTKAVFTNPINILQKISAQAETRYNLKDYIPNNITIKDQGNTNTCWAFAELASLESNLAMRDYKNNENTSKVYDFSERHMEYATSRTFLDNKVNQNGYEREVGEGGNYYLSTAYLVNGTGAISEKDMPFENNEDKIDISEIENKEIKTQVYDTIDYPLYKGTEDTEDLRNEMKLHIKNYGGINAGIHGAQLVSDYYNNDTGAIYCDNVSNCPVNHAVTIIGWDDNYSIKNFNEKHRPTQNGAWIIKNSWGTKKEYTLQEMKASIFKANPDECKEKGWNSSEEILDQFALKVYEDAGYEIQNNIACMKIGDNGYMYVSYQDVTIYTLLSGIIKADDSINYENIYQYDYYGINSVLPFVTSKIYVANVFEKQLSGDEYLNQVSLYAPETYTCRVYVNPNGSGKAKNDFKLVELKDGTSETFEAGYHTLEFLNPVKITGDKFTVLVEITGTRNNEIGVGVEQVINNSYFGNVKVEKEKCFWTVGDSFERNEWLDFGELNSTNSNYPNSDTTIKAFTVSKIEDEIPSTEKKLQSISVSKMPVKTQYIQNKDNLDLTGGIIKVLYTDNSSEEISMNSELLIVEGFNNKILGKNTITVKYLDKTTTFDVNIVENIVEEAESSIFTNMNSNVTKVKAYYYTNASKQQYIVMDVQLNNITRSNKNDSIEYYYYLSSTQNASNIKDWVKITENQTSQDKIEFSINTKDITNFSEVSNSKNLYLYIKEVAKKNTNEKILVTAPVLLKYDLEAEKYIDDVKQSNINNNNNNNNSNKTENIISENNRNNTLSYKNSSVEDTTIANKNLPNAGKTFLIVTIFIITILGILMYIKYERIDK